MGWATSQMATNTMKSKFIYCGHCDKEVSRTKYYAHKRLYYNRSRKEWSQTKRLNFADDLQVDPGLICTMSGPSSMKKVTNGFLRMFNISYKYIYICIYI